MFELLSVSHWGDSSSLLVLVTIASSTQSDRKSTIFELSLWGGENSQMGAIVNVIIVLQVILPPLGEIASLLAVSPGQKIKGILPDRGIDNKKLDKGLNHSKKLKKKVLSCTLIKIYTLHASLYNFHLSDGHLTKLYSVSYIINIYSMTSATIPAPLFTN